MAVEPGRRGWPVPAITITSPAVATIAGRFSDQLAVNGRRHRGFVA
jgi:hypothetical protein